MLSVLFILNLRTNILKTFHPTKFFTLLFLASYEKGYKIRRIEHELSETYGNRVFIIYQKNRDIDDFISLMSRESLHLEIEQALVCNRPALFLSCD